MAPNMPDSTALGAMRACIQKIATGPELSKGLSREEVRARMRTILGGQVAPVQAAVFLIALRMKRETDDENRGVLQALIDATDTAPAPVEELIDVADPYDGYTRILPASPFLPAVLAACGVPAVSHGIDALGIDQPVRAVPLPEDLPPAPAGADQVATAFDAGAAAAAAAEAELAALAGPRRPGPTRDSLVYSAAICLQHLGRHATLTQAARAVVESLDSGAARARFLE